MSYRRTHSAQFDRGDQVQESLRPAISWQWNLDLILTAKSTSYQNVLPSSKMNLFDQVRRCFAVGSMLMTLKKWSATRWTMRPSGSIANLWKEVPCLQITSGCHLWNNRPYLHWESLRPIAVSRSKIQWKNIFSRHVNLCARRTCCMGQRSMEQSLRSWRNQNRGTHSTFWKWRLSTWGGKRLATGKMRNNLLSAPCKRRPAVKILSSLKTMSLLVLKIQIVEERFNFITFSFSH